MLVPQVPVPQSGQTGPDDTSTLHRAHHRRGARLRETPSFYSGLYTNLQPLPGEAFIFFALDSRQTSPELWRETPPLSSKAVLSANILEKISWSKACHCLCLNKQDRPCGIAFWQRLPPTSALPHRPPNQAERYKGRTGRWEVQSPFFCAVSFTTFFPTFLLFMSRNLDGFPQKAAD